MERRQTLELLIQHGCDVNARDDNGQTAIFAWAEFCNSEEDFLSILLDSGADASATD